MKASSFPLLASALLGAALFAGCVSEPLETSDCSATAKASIEQGNDSVRFLKGGVYVDAEYGYCLAFPASWQAEVELFNRFFIDVEAVDTSAGLTLSIRRAPFGSGESLSQIVTNYWTQGPADSIVIRPEQIHDGVEFIIVDGWDTYSSAESANKKRMRIIHFVREDQRFSVTLSDANDAAYSVELQKIESSLRFF